MRSEHCPLQSGDSTQLHTKAALVRTDATAHGVGVYACSATALSGTIAAEERLLTDAMHTVEGFQA